MDGYADIGLDTEFRNEAETLRNRVTLNERNAEISQSCDLRVSGNENDTDRTRTTDSGDFAGNEEGASKLNANLKQVRKTDNSMTKVVDDDIIVVDSEVIDPFDDRKFVRPKRTIGLLGAVSFGIGSVIGSGIFVSPTGALRFSGSVGMSLIVWIVTGLFTISLVLVYSELGSLLPVSGGNYMYIYKGAGPIPAFMYMFAEQVFIEPAGKAVLALVFANYLMAPCFDSCGPPEWLTKVLAVAMLLTICITNIISVRFATRLQIFFTSAKLLTISGIIVTGIVLLFLGNFGTFQNSFEGTATSPTSYAMAVFSCSFALGGANKINEIGDEIVNPRRNIPLALIISVLSVTVLYILTNISYFTVLSKAEFVSSPAVVYDWAVKVLGPAAFVMPILVALSSYGALNGTNFSSGRVLYAVARNGHLPEIMSYLHARTLIPVLSIIIANALAIVLLIPNDVFTLINFVGFVSTLFGALIVFSLLRIRRMTTQDVPTFRVPALVLITAAVLQLFLIVAPFLTNPRIEFLYGIGVCFIGLLLYIPFVRFKLTIPGFNHFVVFCQLLMELCPTRKAD